MRTARYDGQTDWYEAYAGGEAHAVVRSAAVALLGAGAGRVLDLGCGTGRAIPLLAEAGWIVVGSDISADQLAVARENAGAAAERLVHADAHDLPFADGTFDAVVSILTHTDFDDLAAAFREVGRVLRAGAPFVHCGVHPCFGSPFVEHRADGPSLIQPGYVEAGWQRLPPDSESTKIRVRVGINHVPLPGLLNAFAEAGFRIVETTEPGPSDPPLFFGVKALKL